MYGPETYEGGVGAQPVLAPLTRAAVFVVATVDPGGETAAAGLLADLPGLTRSVATRVPTAGLNVVAGIGSGAWDRLFDGPRPAELHVLPEFVGQRHRAPSTPGDLLFHIRAEQMDVCFELAKLIMRGLAGAATVVDEVHGFTYFDDRDVIGFVDGTENPTGPDRAAAALVGDADPTFRGGSYVIVQKYLHDLDGWDALTVAEQEQAVGRTKLDNIELSDEAKPSNSHLALNVIVEPDGTERQIVRHNMVFGAVGQAEFGTYFIGYAASPSITELMLTRMFVGEPAGNHDRILDFSTPVTGGLFFAPPTAFLEDPTSVGAALRRADGDGPDPARPADPADDVPQPAGALGIGSLKP
jgi:putative iron-dependent peroxidase